jgi:hypothetical protein
LRKLVYFSKSPKRAHYLKLLLNNPTVDPCIDSNIAFIEACSRGKLDLVEIMLDDPRIDISDSNNKAIKQVFFKIDKYGPYSTIFRLLKSRLVLNERFIEAVDSGNQTLVIEMLKDPLVNPGIRQNDALKRAVEKGHVEIFRILANNPRVDLSVPGLAFEALIRNRTEILDIILSKKTLNPRYVSSDLICEVAKRGYTELLDKLLLVPNVDPSNFAIFLGALYRHFGIVERLLQHPLVDAADGQNRALRIATENNDRRMVELLLQDSNVQKGPLTRSFRYAVFAGFSDIENLLFQAKKSRLKIRRKARFDAMRKHWNRLMAKND